jgi:hypothetical protein
MLLLHVRMVAQWMQIHRHPYNYSLVTISHMQPESQTQQLYQTKWQCPATAKTLY